MGSSLLRVDFHEVEVVPYAINEIVQTAWIQSYHIVILVMTHLRSISQLMTTVWSSRAKRSIASRLTASILL